ncbi:MAG TPA: sigma-54-dependent Fis family transcriptional regulator [Gammaproteobacteria bacterium]|nr:sigma-54-dependent Fis family transcriptional regulator [Gammaproteobacteria bacterium]
MKVGGRLSCESCDGTQAYIEHLGLSASRCFEEVSKKQLGYQGKICTDQYANLIVNLKNQIGGQFSRASSIPGVVRVINKRCPFGEIVKEAPELCRMTASVLGGIAARNFGYAKVHLDKRIAMSEGRCEILVYTNHQVARDQPGDEYHSEGDLIISKTASAAIISRVEEQIKQAWCRGDREKNNAQKNKPKIIAESQAMRTALEAVEIVAPTLATVMITGETGVGKGVIAHAVHAMSNRGARQLVVVNCGAISENLVESALFGHEKGAFTGAHNVHHGFFDRAEKGTLFLDEINSLPVAAQARLLRVLQNGEFERVGGKQAFYADVRIIAASNQRLEKLVQSGEFREDLYYRLNVLPIHVPPLRERREDLTALVNYLLKKYSEKYKTPGKTLGEEAWWSIMSYDWPGNIRELKNVLERAFLFSPTSVIKTIDLPLMATQQGEYGQKTTSTIRELKKKAAMDVEVRSIRDALVRFQGNVRAVAHEMGISPRAVYMKLKTHGLDAMSYRKSQIRRDH